ncbi:MAG TPA: hypothetical protein VEK11_04535 [Thermoanaerobaculia bacterium]|nr:hypothetical protein [Thermoanaerobaculia bacterium]
MRLRTSPLVELRQLDELSPEQRAPFRDLENDPDFHALLLPRAPLPINLKAVSRATAELLSSLREPALAPLTDDVIDLILDGIVEVETADGFASGAGAYFCAEAAAPDHRPSLSRDALLHAQDLEVTDIASLTRAIYFFHRIPLTQFWLARFPDEEAILAHVGARELLARHWTASHRRKGWLQWSSRTPSPRAGEDVTYKLYVSPRPERFADAFAIAVRVLARYEGVPFKIGDSAAGLLRPDKMVAYFATREQLDEAASVLRRELAGCDAHGVPFTAAIDDEGLLSWGVDPPGDERALQWLGRESWRSWLAQRLGAALAIAKMSHDAPVEPWQFALARARRHGVDVETWTPSAALWSRA